MPLNAYPSSHQAASAPSHSCAAMKLLMATGMVLALGACGNSPRTSAAAPGAAAPAPAAAMAQLQPTQGSQVSGSLQFTPPGRWQRARARLGAGPGPEQRARFPCP